MAVCIIVFFIFIFGILLVNPETRIGVLLAPLWLIALALMYRQYKSIHDKDDDSSLKSYDIIL